MQIELQQRPSVSGKKRVLRIPGGKTKTNQIRVGTWNVRSLLESGKLFNTINEAKRLNIDILGVSETWWPDCGEFLSEGMKIYHSNEQGSYRKGVAFIINQHLAKSVLGCFTKSSRTILLKLRGQPFNINIIQANQRAQ
jgi:exonuclease III